MDGLATMWCHSGGTGLRPVPFQRRGVICQAVNVEAPVGADPMGYLTGGGLSKRTREEMQAEAKKWFVRKFQGRPLKKRQRSIEDRREELAPGRNWRFMLVHGALKHPTELEMIK